VDIRARPTDPVVEALARAVFALFPRCRVCGEAIATFEEAEVRIFSHRAVHKGKCQTVPGSES
jgi:hypothetical protein